MKSTCLPESRLGQRIEHVLENFQTVWAKRQRSHWQLPMGRAEQECMTFPISHGTSSGTLVGTMRLGDPIPMHSWVTDDEICLLLFRDRVFLCNSGWHVIYYIVLALNTSSSCLHLLSARITFMCRNTWHGSENFIFVNYIYVLYTHIQTHHACICI